MRHRIGTRWSLASGTGRRQRTALVTLLIATLGASRDRETPDVATAATPTFRRRTVEYTLQSTSITNLIAEHRALAARGGAPATFGFTSWKVSITTSPRNGIATSCSPDRILFLVELTTTLPAATKSSEFSEADSRSWSEFLSALKRHEAKHDSITVSEVTKFLTEVEQEAIRSPSSKSIPACVADVLERLERASASFDQVSGHGRTEGVVLILRRPPSHEF
ncbi:DUF922 domain-containing protein [Gemmatimonas sp.]|uniref:DUF922 domain-containing protein n=1 Tax=Gemmatimonas sp. TaxID=1962908 RepID=UPI003DA3DC47